MTQAGEISPTALSAQLPMRIEGVTNHLKELTAVGLITRRPTGSFNYACAKSAYSELTPSGRMATCLQAKLKDVDTDDADEWAQVVDQLYSLATAFTHTRRLVILSMLASGELSTTTLRTRFQMSKPALSRHVSKIIDRGFVSAQRRQKDVYLALRSPQPSPLHQCYWEVFILPPPQVAKSA